MSLTMKCGRDDLSDIIAIEYVQGRGPLNQDITRQSIPGRDGSYRIERRVPARPLDVVCAIVAINEVELRDKTNYLNSTLYTNDAVPIVFSDEPDVTYSGQYEGQHGREAFWRRRRR